MKLAKILSSLVLGASIAATSLSANTIYVFDTANDGIPDAGGGEFGAFFTSPQKIFYTFCMESEVDIKLPGTYNYTVSTVVQNQGDTLSVGTAWLYEKFFKGTLSGSAGGSYGDNRDLNAGLLQQAMWALEDEVDGVSTYYVDQAVAHFGSLAAAKADVASSSKVKVLNLWGLTDRKDIQSLVVYVPDSGMTAALLGLGLLSLAAFRRKL